MWLSANPVYATAWADASDRIGSREVRPFYCFFFAAPTALLAFQYHRICRRRMPLSTEPDTYDASTDDAPRSTWRGALGARARCSLPALSFTSCRLVKTRADRRHCHTSGLAARRAGLRLSPRPPAHARKVLTNESLPVLPSCARLAVMPCARSTALRSRTAKFFQICGTRALAKMAMDTDCVRAGERAH